MNEEKVTAKGLEGQGRQESASFLSFVSFQAAFEFGDKLYAVHEQALEKILADITIIRNRFNVYELHKFFVFQRFLSSISPRGIIKFSNPLSRCK